MKVDKKFKEYIDTFNKRYSYLDIVKIKKAKFKDGYAGVVVPDYGDSVCAYNTKHTLYIAFCKDGSSKMLSDRYYPDIGMATNRRWKNVKTGKFTSKEIEDIYNN